MKPSEFCVYLTTKRAKPIFFTYDKYTTAQLNAEAVGKKFKQFRHLADFDWKHGRWADIIIGRRKGLIFRARRFKDVIWIYRNGFIIDLIFKIAIIIAYYYARKFKGKNGRQQHQATGGGKF